MDFARLAALTALRRYCIMKTIVPTRKHPRDRREPVSEKAFRILVVDDDEDVGLLFERLLGGPQEVRRAVDGYEAIDKAEQEP